MKIAYSKISILLGTAKLPVQQLLTAARVAAEEFACNYSELFVASFI